MIVIFLPASQRRAVRGPAARGHAQAPLANVFEICETGLPAPGFHLIVPDIERAVGAGVIPDLGHVVERRGFEGASVKGERLADGRRPVAVVLVPAKLEIDIRRISVGGARLFVILADVVAAGVDQPHHRVGVGGDVILRAPKCAAARVAGVKLGSGIERRRAADQSGQPRAEIEAHESAHAQTGGGAMTAIGEGAQARIDVRDQFLEVEAEIVLAAVVAKIPGRSAIETGVMLGHIAIDRDDDHIVVGDEAGDLRDGIFALIVFFKRVAIAMAVKVVDHRVVLAAGGVAGRQEQAVVALAAENRWSVTEVVERFLARRWGGGRCLG